MIIFFVLTFILTIVSFIFAPFPTISELPWGIDSVMVSGVSGFKYLAELYPPFSTVLTAFLVYIGFRVGIILLRFFLGSRTPTQH